jgi:nicotinamidase-related amidase
MEKKNFLFYLFFYILNFSISSRFKLSQDHSHNENLNSGFKNYERLNYNNSAIIFVDHQVGLLNGVRTQILDELKSSIIFLAKLAKLFNISTLVTTSAENGPNGPLLPEIREILPNVTIFKRLGEINAWDNEEFRKAIISLNKNKLIIAGISTDVCLAFLALSAIKNGYKVYAVLDASGTWSHLIETAAIMRMQKHGIEMINTFAVSGELQLDWRNKTGVEYGKILGQALPFYSNLIEAKNLTTTD